MVTPLGFVYKKMDSSVITHSTIRMFSSRAFIWGVTFRFVCKDMNSSVITQNSNIGAYSSRDFISVVTPLDFVWQMRISKLSFSQIYPWQWKGWARRYNLTFVDIYRKQHTLEDEDWDAELDGTATPRTTDTSLVWLPAPTVQYHRLALHSDRIFVVSESGTLESCLRTIYTVRCRFYRKW